MERGQEFWLPSPLGRGVGEGFAPLREEGHRSLKRFVAQNTLLFPTLYYLKLNLPLHPCLLAALSIHSCPLNHQIFGMDKTATIL